MGCDLYAAAMASPPSVATASAVDRVLHATTTTILDDADHVAERVTEALLAGVPELSADPLSAVETRRAVRATLVALVRGWRRGEALEHVALPPELLFEIRLMVRNGIPASAIARICHLAHGVFADLWGERIAAADLTPAVQGLAMRRAHQITFAWFEGLIAQLTVAYDAERERAARTPERARREAVAAALSGKTVDEDALSRRAGYELRRHHVGLVVWRGSPESDGVPAAADAQPVFARLARAVAAELGAARPLVVAEASTVAWVWIAFGEPPPAGALRAAVARLRPAGVSVAVGDLARGLPGFRSTHGDALAAARVAMLRGGPSAEAVVTFDEVELAALVSGDLPRARRFVRRHLGALADPGPETDRLRATLRAYLDEDGRRTATAHRLGVHPNTVTNRARTCEALIGRPLRERAVELRVALAVREALGEQAL